MRNLKFFFRAERACAVAESDDGSTFYGFIGFLHNQEHYGKTFANIAGVGLSKTNITFGNSALDGRWWLSFEVFSKDQAIQKLKKIADSCKPAKKSGGFSFL